MCGKRGTSRGNGQHPGVTDVITAQDRKPHGYPTKAPDVPDPCQTDQTLTVRSGHSHLVQMLADLGSAR
jgi:hypothetical protein